MPPFHTSECFVGVRFVSCQILTCMNVGARVMKYMYLAASKFCGGWAGVPKNFSCLPHPNLCFSHPWQTRGDKWMQSHNNAMFETKWNAYTMVMRNMKQNEAQSLSDVQTNISIPPWLRWSKRWGRDFRHVNFCRDAFFPRGWEEWFACLNFKYLRLFNWRVYMFRVALHTPVYVCRRVTRKL